MSSGIRRSFRASHAMKQEFGHGRAASVTAAAAAAATGTASQGLRRPAAKSMSNVSDRSGPDTYGPASPAKKSGRPLNTLAVVESRGPVAAEAAADNGVLQLVTEGTCALLYDCMRGASLYRPVAALLALWECVQLLSFCLSPAEELPWNLVPVMDDVADALQVISFGYRLPEASVSAQFAIMFAVAVATVSLSLFLFVGGHPGWEEGRFKLRWPFHLLRWLLILTAQSLYLPVVVQLISAFRCSSQLRFLNMSMCWTSEHVGLAICCGVLLPLFVGIAAVSVVTLFDHETVSKDPYARSHGRTLLLIQLMKLALAILFALEDNVNTAALIIGAVVAQLAALFVTVVYLPFHWQRLNQVMAVGYAIGVSCAAVLILAAARAASGSSMPAWVLLYTAPWGAVCGFMLANMQWHHWIQNADYELANVYQVELKVRRVLAVEPDEHGMVQADALYSHALQFFPRITILHLFVAQYMHEFRQNQHLEKAHLNVLKSAGGPIDEQFFAYLRVRRIQDESQTDEQRNVATRLKIEKLKIAARDHVLAARKLQVAFWAELVELSPSASHLSNLASSLCATMRQCEDSFSQLLALNNSSVQVVRMYAQYLQEVANNRVKADELLVQAAEMEEMQTRAQTMDRDVLFMAYADTLNSSQDNLGVITISSQRHNLGQITDVNAMCLQIIGYTKRELLGKNISVLLPEPISSQHQRYLEAYLDTGRGIMLNSTRTLFMVHSAGYLVPVSSTMRAMDNGFSSILQLLATSDRFIMVSLADSVVTGLCQRTISLLKVSPRQLKAGSIGVHAMLPEFDQLWNQHQDAIAAYEEAALAEIDGRLMTSVSRLPSDVVYMTPLKQQVSEDAPAMTVQVRFQQVKIPGGAVVVVKWRNMDEDDQHTKLGASEPDVDANSLLGDELSQTSEVSSGHLDVADDAAEADADDDDDDDQIGEVEAAHVIVTADSTDSVQLAHSSQALLLESSDSKDLSDSKASPEHAPVEVTGPPRLQLRQPANRNSPSELASPSGKKMFSGRSSQGSAASSSSVGAIRRRIDRASKISLPAISRLSATIIVLMGIAVGLLIVNNVASSSYLPSATGILQAMRDNVDRATVLEAAALRVQDLVLHAEGFALLPPAVVSQRQQELLMELDTFERLHQSLYIAVADDMVAARMYSTADIPVYVRDENGLVSLRKQNLLSLGIDMVAEGRQAAAKPLSQFTRSTPGVWFFIENIPELGNRVFGRLLARAASAVNLLSGMADLRTTILAVVLAAFGLVSIGMLVPLLYRVQALQMSMFQGFLHVPVQVLRGLHSQAENGLTAALAANDGIDEDLDTKDDSDQPISMRMVIESVKSSQGKGAGKARYFRKEAWVLWKALAIFLLPVVAIMVVCVLLYVWGQGVTSSLQQYSVELRLSGELALFTSRAYYNLRESLMQDNYTLAMSSIVTATQLAAKLSTSLAAVTLGSEALNARPALRLPTLAHLFLVSGCDETVDAQCSTFAHGLLESGLTAALDYNSRIMGQYISQQSSYLARSGGNVSQAFSSNILASPSMQISDVMMHLYVMTPLNRLTALQTDALAAEVDQHLSSLITVTVICIVCVGVIYVLFYRPRVKELDERLRRSQFMLLLLPDELMQGVPAVREMVTKILSST